MPVHRRQFLQSSLLATAVAGWNPEGRKAVGDEPPGESPSPVVDTHVYLSQWPMRRMHGDEPHELVGLLREAGVEQAWAGSFDALLHKDIGAVNQRLFEDCREYGEGLLVPFGAVNPKLPDWEEDLRRCHEEYRMPGIRLHPNYHQYALDDADFRRLLRLATERGLLVQVVGWMEDERHQHPLMPVPAVKWGPLPEMLRRQPEARLMLLNGFRVPGGKVVRELADSGQVWFDFAQLDIIQPLNEMLDVVPAERIMFGSFSPMFYFAAAKLKMQESQLTAAQRQAIAHENARQLLAAR